MPSNVMEIRPASLDQIQQSPDGAWVEVQATVGDFAKKIAEIDTGGTGVTLHLSHNVKTGIFAVFQRLENGNEELLQTAEVLDDRLVNEVRRIVHRKLNGGSLVDELQAQRAKRDRDEAHANDERLGEVGELTSHVVKKELGIKDRAFIGKGLILP